MGTNGTGAPTHIVTGTGSGGGAGAGQSHVLVAAFQSCPGGQSAPLTAGDTSDVIATIAATTAAPAAKRRSIRLIRSLPTGKPRPRPRTTLRFSTSDLP